jgi:hypothetical protein
VSAQRGARLTVTAGVLLMAFAVLVAINTAATAATGGATGADVSFVALLVVVAAVAGRSLHLGARWAWWISLALASVGLFFVAPVTGTLLLGGTLEPVGTGWDVVFFPLITVDLLALVVVLWRLRGRTPSTLTRETP